MKTLIGALALILTISTQAKRIDIWPSIPFIRGADICQFQNAYGQTRSEYMRDMVRNAEDIMYAGALGMEALQMLVTFDSLYDKNQALATRNQHLDVTLENTLKGYLDQYYRQLRPREKKISFKHVNGLKAIVDAAKRGQRIGYFNDSQLNELDFIAYGSYALAPNCRGNVQVTLTLVGRNGETFTYIGNGKIQVVMSQIASQIFEQFQRTQFPSTIRVGNRTLTLLGGMNGSVDITFDPRNAERACQTLGGRLPTREEYEMADAYGDWSGGVGLGKGKTVWDMANNKVYHPGLRNPTPVRDRHQVNAREFSYYCVR